MLNRSKFLLTTMLFLVLALLMVACGSQADPTATPEPAPEPVEEAEVAPEQEEEAAEPTEVVVESVQEDAEQAEEVVEEMPVTNAVVVEDQAIVDGNTVTINSVTADVDGWLVVHAQAEGRPGPIVGMTAVQAGENTGVMVEIDPSAATETLYAMLHVDVGTPGEFDFPGDDVPAVDAEGNVVTPPFMVMGGLAEDPTIILAQNDEMGSYLADADGWALYTFAFDSPGTSNCYDQCAVAWPPYLVEEGDQLVAGDGIPGELGMAEREDGTFILTYDQWPLYYWVNDEQPGDITGHNVGNVWALAFPETHVFLGGNEELGSFLAGPDGLTLYRFNIDQAGVSNCTGECAVNWPPFLVEDGDLPRGNAGVVGDLDTIEREDGSIQVTYQGMPLYYWVNDEAPGDATGQGFNDVWFVVRPYTVSLGSSDELGDFLIGANRMTLYLFTNDEAGISNCSGQCADNWPPLLVQAGEVPVPGDGVTGSLGVIERDDGSLQVTYDGLPLYFWVNDEEVGDTTGNGVNDVWFVVPPTSDLAGAGEDEEIDY